MGNQLVNVTSRATIVARTVSLITFLAGMAVNFGWIEVGTADRVNDWARGSQAEAIIVGVAMLVTALLPAVQGWMSRDRELPDGVKLDDVVVRQNAPALGVKQERLARAIQGKIPAIVLAALLGTAALGGLSACSSTCPQTGTPFVSMQQQQAAGACVVQPQFPQ